METLADVKTAPQTRLVTTGTMVGIAGPTPEEVGDFMQIAGSACMDGNVFIPREAARRLYKQHTVYCIGCVVCTLKKEGYQLWC